jgi:hypothetical protein
MRHDNHGTEASRASFRDFIFANTPKQPWELAIEACGSTLHLPCLISQCSDGGCPIVL